MACGAPGQTLGELVEREGPFPRGCWYTLSWLFLPTTFPTNPSPPHHSRPPAHSATNPATSGCNSWLWSTPCIREGSSPLTPEGGSISFLASPQFISLCPHSRKGEIQEQLGSGGLLSKADASVCSHMTGLSSGRRIKL